MHLARTMYVWKLGDIRRPVFIETFTAVVSCTQLGGAYLRVFIVPKYLNGIFTQLRTGIPLSSSTIWLLDVLLIVSSVSSCTLARSYTSTSVWYNSSSIRRSCWYYRVIHVYIRVYIRTYVPVLANSSSGTSVRTTLYAYTHSNQYSDTRYHRVS